MRVGLGCLRKSRQASVAGVEEKRRRIFAGEAQEVSREVREGPWVSNSLVGHCETLDFLLNEMESWWRVRSTEVT